MLKHPAFGNTPAFTCYFMDTLCATFEEWYLGDGIYPPLHIGQKVNLSFCINPADKTITAKGDYVFEQIRHSDYRFCGKVIRNYTDSHNQIIIVDVGNFKFYIEELDKAFKPAVGQFISGHGILLLDYYIWVEKLNDYPDPPNLFFNFQVDSILKVAIPERFIHRHASGLSSPASLSPEDYTDNDVQVIEDMRRNHSSTEFYLLNLRFIEEEVARTFI